MQYARLKLCGYASETKDNVQVISQLSSRTQPTISLCFNHPTATERDESSRMGNSIHGEFMFFRFIATLVILTTISVLGITLEKQNLAVKRAISVQHYELHDIDEQRSQLFLTTQQLGAIPRLLREWDDTELAYVQSANDSADAPLPLLEWRLRAATVPEPTHSKKQQAKVNGDARAR